MSVRFPARRVVDSPGAPRVRSVVRARRSLPSSDAVALTFDDGPDPVHTPLVLDRLRDLGIIGTFFLVGSSARANPDLAVGSPTRAMPSGRTRRRTPIRGTYRCWRWPRVPAGARRRRSGDGPPGPPFPAAKGVRR